MHYLFFTDRRNYQRINSMERQMLLNDKPIECHELCGALNYHGDRIIMNHGFTCLQNVICRASAISHASASITRERKRAWILLPNVC